MRSLEQALTEHDLITLRVIGEWWELDLSGADKKESVKMLTDVLSQVDMQKELLFLPPEEADAINDLVAQDGRIPVNIFSRNHGEVRLMGPGRMEREEPWMEPVSPTEALWYRGFLYRAFDETAEGVLEFYFLPTEIMANFPQVEVIATVDEEEDHILRPLKSPPETWQQADVTAVDDLTALMTITMGLSGESKDPIEFEKFLLNPDPERRSLLLTLANEMSLVRRENGSLRPTRSAIGWLKKGRNAQLCSLGDTWSNSEWNDLCHTPGLRCEGENWHNDPILARTALLDAMPHNANWYRISELVEAIKAVNPDFQRPDGNYDTWYIKETGAQEYLAGFDSWGQVEGRLIRFLIQYPLYWLGMTELAYLDDWNKAAYRLTQRAMALLSGKEPGEEEKPSPIIVEPDGRIVVPQNATRYNRFQVARISEARPVASGKPYLYQLTPHALEQANQQGIKLERILKFLSQAGERPLPKSVHRAITRWHEKGVEAILESVIVLRVNDEAILETLRNNPRTRDYIGESLGELAVVIKPGMWGELRAATTKLGLLLETNL